MDEKTREAIESIRSILGGWSFHAGFPSSEGLEALAHLQAMAEENERLRKGTTAECDYRAKWGMCDQLDDLYELRAEHEQAMKALIDSCNDELAALKAEVVRRQDRHTIDMMELESASKAEAELARWKPLIEAAEKAEMQELIWAAEEATWLSSAQILTAALSCRESPESDDPQGKGKP